MSLASSAFQNPENFVKLKISQTNTPGAQELVEEVGDEFAEYDNTNVQLDEEIGQFEEPYQELQPERLKVGMMDMNQMEPAVFKKNLDMKITGMASETEGLGSENHNIKLAVQGLDMTEPRHDDGNPEPQRDGGDGKLGI